MTVLAANVDDATGEQLAHAVEALLEAGAHDAWLTPVVMKKGRPGSVVNVLCDPAQVGALRAVLRHTTGTIGVRATSGERWPAARSMESVWVDGQLVRVKVSAGRVKAEYEDVARGSPAGPGSRFARWPRPRRGAGRHAGRDGGDASRPTGLDG